LDDDADDAVADQDADAEDAAAKYDKEQELKRRAKAQQRKAQLISDLFAGNGITNRCVFFSARCSSLLQVHI